MTTFYVGIDPSISNTGITILREHGRLVRWGESSGLVDKKILGHKIERYDEIARKSAAFIYREVLHTPIVCCYEDYSFDSTNKSYSLGELGGVLKTTLFQYFTIKLYLVPPTTLKLFATGYGGATKEMMKESFSIKEDAPKIGVPSGDIIDSYFLAEMACYVGGNYPPSMFRPKLEVVKNYLKTTNPIIN